MKTSFIIGWVALFVACVLFDSIVQQNEGFTLSQSSMIYALTHPTGTDITALSSIPVISEATGIITGVWSFCKTLIQMIVLWFPSIWTGTWIWVYYFVCLPVAIGFIVSIVFILRGVGNG